ncbi:MAG: hypothetical protein AB1758_13920 [Candidatus Eremiobacterota bacterium]
MLSDCRRNPAVRGLATPDRVVGRRVLQVTFCAGSYGMGGPGFLGLRLDSGEWLVCTLWGAEDWITVNGQWLGCHPAQYQQQRPLHGESWDDFAPLVLGREIASFACSERACALRVGDALLEITDDPADRPLFFGSREPRQLQPGEDLRQAWVLATTDDIPI